MGPPDEPSAVRLLTGWRQDAGSQAFASAGLALLRVSDVGLPGGMNGRQVADFARMRRPDLKVLFITGYVENAAVGDGQLEPGMELLTQPFEMNVLVQRIRSMLQS